MTSDTGGEPAEDVSFSYVYIPWDLDKPIQQQQLTIPKAKEVEAFTDHLKVHYKKVAGKATQQQRQAHKEALLASLGDKAAGVDLSMLDIATGMQLVENIALLTNSPETGFVGVNMYCDDTASIKDSPTNPRATQIAQLCGKPLEVKGDVFLARVFDNEEDFRRMDFTLQELSSSAGWVREAAEQARRRQHSQADTQDFMDRVQQRAAAGPPQVLPSNPADTEKEKGNAAVKQGKWAEATAFYTAAIKLDSGLTAAYNNRALAYIKLGKWLEAESDCDVVLAREAANVKALLRRAHAREAQDNATGALGDYRAALAAQPQNKEAGAAVKRLEQYLASAAAPQ